MRRTRGRWRVAPSVPVAIWAIGVRSISRFTTAPGTRRRSAFAAASRDARTESNVHTRHRGRTPRLQEQPTPSLSPGSRRTPALPGDERTGVRRRRRRSRQSEFGRDLRCRRAADDARPASPPASLPIRRPGRWTASRRPPEQWAGKQDRGTGDQGTISCSLFRALEGKWFAMPTVWTIRVRVVGRSERTARPAFVGMPHRLRWLFSRWWWHQANR